MKPSQLYASLFASAMTLAATGLSAQGSSDATRASDAAMSPSAAGISRITTDDVAGRFTAKDLIGASVYDPAGEKIGTIHDIDLQDQMPAALGSAYNTDHPAKGMANPPSVSTTRPSRVPAASGDLARATLYLSVGGLFGIGDDLVSVPAGQLTYNSEEDRFELLASKDAVVALSNDKPMSATSETAAGKQSFAAEAQRVQKALEADPSTSAFAHKVTVTTDGESIELRGTVDNSEQKKKLLDAAKRTTTFDLNDELEVNR